MFPASSAAMLELCMQLEKSGELEEAVRRVERLILWHQGRPVPDIKRLAEADKRLQRLHKKLESKRG